jgi:glutamyl-tRNA synthetase
MDKLLWFNKHYLDQLSAAQLIDEIEFPEFDKSEYSILVIETIRERCSSLNDFSFNSFYFFNDPTEYDDQLIRKHCNENTSDHMTLLESSMTSLEDWNQVSVKEVIDETVASLSVGFGKIGLPLRLALTGTVNSPSIDVVCSILGKEVTLERLNSFLNRIKN